MCNDQRWFALRPWQRHSLVLAVAGGVYLMYGATLLATGSGRSASLNLAFSLAPPGLWATVWVCVGLLALASTRWPPRSKTWGYTALSGLAVAWASMQGLGVLLLDAPKIGLNGMLVWGLVGFLWWAISGLVNPDDVPKVR
jgi:hypothetical protein